MRDTAEAQLERVFYLLSAASLANGVTYEELEEATGASHRQSARDAVVLGDRVLYHPAGGTAGADILVDSERVQVVARGASHRPLRLSGREAAALALVLPVLAHMIALAPSSTAFATATTMPRSLNEPVGLQLSSLK